MKIIFIILDDLGWNDTEVHNKNIYTPNLVEFAKESCELNHNYTFSVCGPTRAMIQTGLYSFSYGFQTLFSPLSNYGLNENIKIIPNYLKEINYSTFAVGKWHLGHNQKKWLPHKRGYDYHYGNLSGCIDHYSHKNCLVNLYDFSENGKIVRPNGHACDIVTNKTIEIIENNKNKDFFIYLAYNSPHSPLQSPDGFSDFYRNIDEPRKSYLAMVSHLDYNLGKIFKKLKDADIFEETLIWIQSDNGGWLVDFAGGDNWPLKGGKASFYEGGVRSFSLIRHKDIKIRSYDGISHAVDFLPTILDFCDYKKEIKLDGVSLKENLLKNQLKQREIVISFYDKNFWCFLIDGIKIINENNKIECYNILQDKNEEKNIFQNLNEKIKLKIGKLIEKCSVTRVPEPDQREMMLEGLSYIGQTGLIKVLSCSQNLEKINHKNFLSLSGYDIFYEK